MEDSVQKAIPEGSSPDAIPAENARQSGSAESGQEGAVSKSDTSSVLNNGYSDPRVDRLRTYLRECAHLFSTLELLKWDMEVNLPRRGIGYRAQVMQTLSALYHERITADVLGEYIEEVLALKDLPDRLRKNVEVLKQQYEQARAIPTTLLAEFQKETTIAYAAWLQARQQNAFSLFAPHLQRLLELAREMAGCLQPVTGHDHVYDALLYQFDRSASLTLLDRVFSVLREQFLPVMHRVIEGMRRYSDQVLRQHFPKQKQWDFSLFVLRDIGFGLGEWGRQDYSPHPFTAGIGVEDVRITTRVDEHYFPELLLATLHEMGHALYDYWAHTGKEAWIGFPETTPANLSLHESQSRFWENWIGRSFAFWQRFYLPLQAYFPEQLGGTSLDTFYRALNYVRPTLIRVGADELTYHMHILVRYEIERALVEGNLPIEEAPQVWRTLYKKYLDVDVPSDREGILQDVHWAHGTFGYFPTYTLGTLYAAQLAATMERTFNVEEAIQQGQWNEIIQWLKQHVYQWGNLLSAEELCRQVTGEPLNPYYFIMYVRRKYEVLV